MYMFGSSIISLLSSSREGLWMDINEFPWFLIPILIFSDDSFVQEVSFPVFMEYILKWKTFFLKTILVCGAI